ncbi:hypothetical protein KUV89_01120 [Marinobacter hydrocarbonoclasticus]|nr:hypothetical protein [Marinobacter nauticus]
MIRSMALALMSVLCLMQVFANCLSQPVHLDDLSHPMGEQVAHAHNSNHGLWASAVPQMEPTAVGEHEHSLHSHLPCHPPMEYHLPVSPSDSGHILALVQNRPERRMAPPLPPPNA